MFEDLSWLENFFSTLCDGEWEHEYGIKIYTLDNPGWSIEVDLFNTKVHIENKEWELFEKTDSDWYGYMIKDNKFIASGDSRKLQFLLELFKGLIIK